VARDFSSRPVWISQAAFSNRRSGGVNDHSPRSLEPEGSGRSPLHGRRSSLPECGQGVLSQKDARHEMSILADLYLIMDGFVGGGGGWF
jgi:hypothetical protein